MKNLVKTTLFALSLSTSMALADGKTNTKLDVNQALPQTVVTVDSPEFPFAPATIGTSYSPQQKAKIAGLTLTSEVEYALPLKAEFTSLKYSPMQMAKIVGLKLTAEEVQNELSQTDETAPSAYSPQQKAKIAGLVLTAE